MDRKTRYSKILGWFSLNDPDPKTELSYGSPFQLLVAVVLSAQCTDKRVNMITPALFDRFPTPEAMASATREEIRGLIGSVTYPGSKSGYLLGLSKTIVEKFGGQVPGDTASLMTLPGVGRKTANVLVSVLHGAPVIAVDTHVFRVSRRLGLSDGKTVEAVEKDLERHIPEELRPRAHHWLLLHGRYTCTARKPGCGGCPLKEWCRHFSSAGEDSAR